MVSRRKQDLSAEQLAELAQMRTESQAPQARADEISERDAIAREIPPATLLTESVEALAALRLARENKGLSLQAVSDKAGIDPASLSRIERGQGNPTMLTLNRIAGAMGLRMEVSFVEAD